jgi:hypothetical protein
MAALFLDALPTATRRATFAPAAIAASFAHRRSYDGGRARNEQTMAAVFMTSDVLTAKRRRLEILEETAATSGRDTPPHVKLEIEDLREELGVEASMPANEAERFAVLAASLQDVYRRLDGVGRRVDQILWLMPILMVALCGLLILLVKL